MFFQVWSDAVIPKDSRLPTTTTDKLPQRHTTSCSTMARTLYSTALLLALLTCLYALPVKTLSEAEGAELSQLPAEEARELQLAGPTTPAEADAEAETEDGCSMEGDQDDEAIHTSLRRRCVGRERKLSWPWGRSRSKTEVEGENCR